MYKKSKNSLIIGKRPKNPPKNPIRKNAASKGGFFLHIKSGLQPLPSFRAVSRIQNNKTMISFSLVSTFVFTEPAEMFSFDIFLFPRLSFYDFLFSFKCIKI